MTEEMITKAVDAILADYGGGRDIDRTEPIRQPDQDAIIDIIRKLRRIVFPGYFPDRGCGFRHPMSMLIEDVMFRLRCQIASALPETGEKAQADAICLEFLEQIPAVRSLVQTDLQAACDGDPAASGKTEVILSYPGLFAVTVYRLAHVLHLLGVPLIPRIMTEHAHSLTGIDIHPGAEIGNHFFIDHGTGVVIGETTVIGDGVKLYQGVTLGGLSTRGGQSLRGVKRHPTIGDRVTIYANAAILGGDTVIGHDCVIGASAFITESVAPCTTVRMKSGELQYKGRKCPGEG